MVIIHIFAICYLRVFGWYSAKTMFTPTMFSRGRILDNPSILQGLPKMEPQGLEEARVELRLVYAVSPGPLWIDR